MKFSWNSIKQKTLEYSLPILLGIAAFLLISYYVIKYGFHSTFAAHAWGFKEMFGIALAILSSGIFLAVLKWFQFMGFFREEMYKIVQSSQFNAGLKDAFHEVQYSDDYLKNRTDIEALWKKVTKCYFNSEFPDEVSDKINARLSEVFFHNNKLSHFMRTCISTIHVSIDADGFLLIKETNESRIVRNSSDPFKYDFCYYLDNVKEDDKKSFISINHFEVDKDIKKLEDIVSTEKSGSQVREKLATQLEGQKEYNIVIKAELSYNIEIDNVYTFSNERAVEYMRVEVNHSKDLQVHFVTIGNEQFSDVENQPLKFVKVYNDLLLPDKGFKLIFVKNKAE